MSVGWIVTAAVAPLLPRLVVAWPFWRLRIRDEIGTIVGSGVVFACALLFIGREYTEYEQIRAWCVVREIACRFSPGLVNRCAIYGFIGMVQVFLLFLIGLGVEERLRVREGQDRPR